MLQLSLSDGLFVYLAIWLGVIIFLWLREHRRATLADWELSKGKLFTCEKCHHSFIDKEMRNVSRCPKCNAMCISRKHKN